MHPPPHLGWGGGEKSFEKRWRRRQLGAMFDDSTNGFDVHSHLLHFGTTQLGGTFEMDGDVLRKMIGH